MSNQYVIVVQNHTTDYQSIVDYCAFTLVEARERAQKLLDVWATVETALSYTDLSYTDEGPYIDRYSLFDAGGELVTTIRIMLVQAKLLAVEPDTKYVIIAKDDYTPYHYVVAGLAFTLRDALVYLMTYIDQISDAGYPGEKTSTHLSSNDKVYKVMTQQGTVIISACLVTIDPQLV